MDPSGRVSLLDLTASLEGAMLGEGKTQSGGHHWCIVCTFMCIWYRCTIE